MSLSLRANPCLRATRQWSATKHSIVTIAPRRVIKFKPRLVVRAEEDDAPNATHFLSDLKDKWDSVDNKPQAVMYGVGGILGIWLTVTVIDIIDDLPVLPKVLELIGLSYSAWFTYRYLLFKASREELMRDVEELKDRLTGN